MELEEFKEQCQVFIFSWRRVSENAKQLQKQFSGLGLETFVINSDETENDNGLPNWVNIGESGYMVQQYAKAKEVFDRTYFVELFADIYDVNAELIVERACYVFSEYDCGVYAPNADYIEWNFDRKRLPKLERNLYEVKNAESLLSFIHKDVLAGLKLSPEKYRIGWGIDFLVCILASRQGKLVVRDYATTVRHPKGKGYSGSEARQEYEQFVEDLGPEIAGLMKQWCSEAKELRKKKRKRRRRKRRLTHLVPELLRRLRNWSG